MSLSSTTSIKDKCYERLDWPCFDVSLLKDLCAKSLEAPRATDHEPRGWLFSVIQTPWSLREWAIQNLPIELTDEWIVAFHRFQQSPHVAPHRDSVRKYSYNCLLTEAGPCTQFYNEKGEVFDSVVYEKNRWYYHNSSIPHGVHNSDTSGKDILRTAVTVFKVELDHYAKPPSNLPGIPQPSKATPEMFYKAFRKDPFFYYA